MPVYEFQCTNPDCACIETYIFPISELEQCPPHPETGTRFMSHRVDEETGEPVLTVCDECQEGLLAYKYGPVAFCLIVDHGGLLGPKVRDGSIGQDTLDRRKEQLRKRSLAYDLTPQGQAKRMATQERLEKRWGVPLKDAPFTLKHMR